MIGQLVDRTFAYTPWLFHPQVMGSSLEFMPLLRHVSDRNSVHQNEKEPAKKINKSENNLTSLNVQAIIHLKSGYWNDLFVYLVT